MEMSKITDFQKKSKHSSMDDDPFLNLINSEALELSKKQNLSTLPLSHSKPNKNTDCQLCQSCTQKKSINFKKKNQLSTSPLLNIDKLWEMDDKMLTDNTYNSIRKDDQIHNLSVESSSTNKYNSFSNKRINTSKNLISKTNCCHFQMSSSSYSETSPISSHSPDNETLINTQVSVIWNELSELKLRIKRLEISNKWKKSPKFNTLETPLTLSKSTLLSNLALDETKILTSHPLLYAYKNDTYSTYSKPKIFETSVNPKTPFSNESKIIGSVNTNFSDTSLLSSFTNSSRQPLPSKKIRNTKNLSLKNVSQTNQRIKEISPVVSSLPKSYSTEQKFCENEDFPSANNRALLNIIFANKIYSQNTQMLFENDCNYKKKLNTYDNKPVCIIEPNLWLFAEPETHIAEKFNVVINVAKEVKNPFLSQISLEESSKKIKNTSDEKFFQKNHLPIESSILPPVIINDIEYLHVLWDHNANTLSIDLPPLIDYITKKSIQENKKVLIHCQCGISRSASLIIAYVMKSLGLNVDSAYSYVKDKSPWIGPNMSLIYQLYDFNNFLYGKKKLSDNKKRTSPNIEISRSTLSSSLASPIGYASLKHINYPTFVLGKSCKLIPVMAIHTIFYKTRFAYHKYLIVSIITSGIIIFTLYGSQFPSETKKNQLSNNIWGLFLLSINLLLDGYTNSTQDQIFKAFPHISGPWMMMSMNIISTIGTTLYIYCFTNELVTTIEFIKKYPSIIYDIFIYGCLGAVGQLFIFHTLEQFGSLVLITITLTRKMLTLLISLIWFNHKLTIGQWIGVGLVFYGTGLEAYIKHTQLTKNAQKHT
ncbi:hypothetical protein PORY_000262 [Pneumocystis oryctolagi]|uniref:Uncharacterized protein n=1 Tax=Pneumocystis oryctolagi TaxID=42067 RepID=A0ACB7CJE6_9ASCO|nr:hypothetical protein PORY_000262 [Pneumocystis oryctolagi]